ncbi:uncharacterized protein LOC107267564 isoform X3 [Cephus cinctus]|uniref:Uncharacterized protein LOC107267564 isoform X3 n=1 Tax=Cephus cinctus TaxID=211228 RepID=A0AAJ7RHT9_CEPCN|nr:uncharacterized protein LOC107267564 isoform X3 [Cephus cinctus]
MNAEEDYNVAARYRTVRKHLDNLGYKQALSLDALPLIERLLADLIQTTESLKHFKSIAQDNIEACSQLQLAVEPYKCDNARLVQECNHLHSELIETKEAHQKQLRDLKKQVRKLESKCCDLKLASSRNLQKIKELESESSKKSKKILELQGKCCKPVINNVGLATKKRASYPLRRPTLESDALPRSKSSTTTLPSLRKVEPHIVDLLSTAEHKMNCLNRELASKEKEIQRLKKMLEGGRPFAAVSKDCCCRRVDKNHRDPDNNEVKILQQAKLDLELQLKDAINKQHDAMSQAVKLAERNEELEKELSDIDRIALAVEADCNTAVKENNRRVCKLQEKLEDVMTQVHVLESELTVERREVQELRADLEASKLEKRNIQRVLESTLDEKKQMTDRINQLTVIEKSLNDEIERLIKENEYRKEEITQLKCNNNLLEEKIRLKTSLQSDNGDALKKMREKGDKNDKNKGKKITKKRTASKGHRSPSPSTRAKNIERKESLCKESEVTKDTNVVASNGEAQKIINEKDMSIMSLRQTIERLETERDYYRNEYNKFREQFNKGSDRDNADLWTQASELRRQLNEKERAIQELQREKKELCREKFNLEARLQTNKTHQRRSCIPCNPCSPCRPVGSCTCASSRSPPESDTNVSKATLERLERERDTARADVERLAEERDALRERLKMAAEAHTSEQRRLRESLTDAETRLKHLERERQDLLIAQGTRRATINGLEDQLEDMREELKKTKQELATQHTQYFQLRALQDQTDQALGDVQGQLAQSETELNKAMDRNRSLEQQQMQLDNQVKELKQEISKLCAGMAQLDQEKDQLLMELDEKTERIAALERELRVKEQEAIGVEQQVREIEHKNQLCLEQSAEQERQLRGMHLEMENLQRQLANASADRENAIQENRRLQDDLASVTCEVRNLQRELEASRGESYDLKRQLQTYVSEVRRAEDLLNRKENERTEMLNHFRSLSLEATVLENNNHSLESEAAEARGALQSARDRLLDLERQLADRDCLIRGYETQITELTQNVASMETQLRQQGEQRKRAEADLNAVRDLCVQLDQQKETLLKQIGDKDAIKAQCEAQLTRLKAEQNMVQDQMDRDHAAVDRLEVLLSQARQESMNTQTANQELQNEMTRLKQKITELQTKLSDESSELRRYQNQAAEYSKQISELRRQMTNERFDRARKEEESRRISSKTDDFCPKRCAKSEICRTNRFPMRPAWTSVAPVRKCRRNANETCSNAYFQFKDDETPCIKIILYPDTIPHSNNREYKSALTSNQTERYQNSQRVPSDHVALDQISMKEQSHGKATRLPIADISHVEHANHSSQQTSGDVRGPLLERNARSTYYPRNVQSVSSQPNSNLKTVHSTSISMQYPEIDETCVPTEKRITIKTSDDPISLSKPCLTLKDVTYSEERIDRGLVNPLSDSLTRERTKTNKKKQKLSERIKHTIRSLKRDSDKTISILKPCKASKVCSATSLHTSRSVSQKNIDTNLTQNETHGTGVACQGETDTETSTSVGYKDPTHLETTANPNSQSEREMIEKTICKKTFTLDKNLSKFSFRTAPHVPPCGTENTLTQEELLRAPSALRTNDRSNSHEKDSWCQSISQERKGNTNDRNNLDDSHDQRDCCGNIQDDTSGYNTSETQKTEKSLKFDDTKMHLSADTNGVQSITNSYITANKTVSVTSKIIETDANLTNDTIALFKSALNHIEKLRSRTDTRETNTEVSRNSNKTESPFLSGRVASITALDLTKPDFVRILTEIKEHTRSLERQLAEMNNIMKSKSSMINVNDTLSTKNTTKQPDNFLPSKITLIKPPQDTDTHNSTTEDYTSVSVYPRTSSSSDLPSISFDPSSSATKSATVSTWNPRATSTFQQVEEESNSQPNDTTVESCCGQPEVSKRTEYRKTSVTSISSDSNADRMIESSMDRNNRENNITNRKTNSTSSSRSKQKRPLLVVMKSKNYLRSQISGEMIEHKEYREYGINTVDSPIRIIKSDVPQTVEREEIGNKPLVASRGAVRKKLEAKPLQRKILKKDENSKSPKKTEDYNLPVTACTQSSNSHIIAATSCCSTDIKQEIIPSSNNEVQQCNTNPVNCRVSPRSPERQSKIPKALEKLVQNVPQKETIGEAKKSESTLISCIPPELPPGINSPANTENKVPEKITKVERLWSDGAPFKLKRAKVGSKSIKKTTVGFPVYKQPIQSLHRNEKPEECTADNYTQTLSSAVYTESMNNNKKQEYRDTRPFTLRKLQASKRSKTNDLSEKDQNERSRYRVKVIPQTQERSKESSNKNENNGAGLSQDLSKRSSRRLPMNDLVKLLTKDQASIKHMSYTATTNHQISKLPPGRLDSERELTSMDYGTDKSKSVTPCKNLQEDIEKLKSERRLLNLYNSNQADKCKSRSDYSRAQTDPSKSLQCGTRSFEFLDTCEDSYSDSSSEIHVDLPFQNCPANENIRGKQ